jgi:TPR repeat protein
MGPRLIFLSALLLCAVRVSHADFYEAMLAYADKDHARAAAELRPLAERGHPPSQHNLGLMRLRGEGGPGDLVEGVGWLLASRDNGWQAADAALQKLLPAMEASQIALAREHEKRFGKDAIAASWTLPPVASVPRLERQAKIRPSSIPQQDALFAGFKNRDYVGWVEVACIVDAHGFVRETLITEAWPAALDTSRVVPAGRRLAFEPAVLDRRPAAAWINVIHRANVELVPDEKSKSWRTVLSELQAGVKNGDPVAQYEYSRVAARFPTLRVPQAQWVDALRLASESSYPPALYRVGTTRELTGTADRALTSRLWLQKAATAGFGPAQLRVALTSWAAGDDAGRARARRWLEAAVADGYAPAHKYLAALLIESDRSEGARARARELTEAIVVSAPYDTDPDAWQIQAAVRAASGNWGEAIAAQEKAIGLAQTLRWPTARLEARLQALRSNVQDTGDLVVLPVDAYGPEQGAS